MDNIGQYIQSKLNDFKNTVAQSAGNAMNGLGQAVHTTENYFNPSSNGGNNFWGAQGPAQSTARFLNPQPFVQSAIQPFQDVYKATTQGTDIPSKLVSNLVVKPFIYNQQSGMFPSNTVQNLTNIGQTSNQYMTGKITKPQAVQNLTNNSLAFGGLLAGPEAKTFKSAPNKFGSLLDNQTKFEIPDNGATIKGATAQTTPWGTVKPNTGSWYDKAAKGTTLGKLMNHPQLYENYPELRDVQVNTRTLPPGTMAQYDPVSNSITINNANPAFINAPKTEVLNTLLHEAQHAIQYKEGFNVGTNLDTSNPSKYVNNAGEVEARAVADRRKFTPAQRLANDPYASQGVPLKNIITKFEGDTSSAAKIPDENLRKSVPKGSYSNNPLNDNPLLGKVGTKGKIPEEDEFIKGLEEDKASYGIPPSEPPKGSPGMPPTNPPETTQERGFRSAKPLDVGEDLKQALHTHYNEKEIGRVKANMTNLRSKEIVDNLDITPKQELALVHYSQNPKPSTIKNLQERGYDIDQKLINKAQPLLNLHKVEEQSRFERANKAGISTNELANHIYQQYHQSPQEINSALEGKGLNKKPGFTFRREYPTYLAAEDKLGLTPKYTTFGQSHASADEALDKAIANKNLKRKLIQNKDIVPSSDAPRGYKAINSDYFPRDKNNEVYMAEPKKAEMINNYFGGNPQSPVSKGLGIMGTVSSKLQSLLLTTPTYTIHGFTIANALRDIATGLGDAVTLHPLRGANTASSGITAMVRGFIPGASEAFERNHASSIREMASQGVASRGVTEYAHMQKNVADHHNNVTAQSLLNGAKDKYNALEHAVVGNPTFNKFMNQRKISLYENFRDSLISQGLSKQEAIRTAANQLRNYDGVIDSIGRNPDFQNFLKSFFFAPKYRESIINSQLNAVKGLFNPNNKNYDMSRRLAFGLGVTFLAYNEMNKSINGGRNIWQNGAGHELDLAIPNGTDDKGQKKYYYIPWMPGTTTVPRMAVGTVTNLLKGDTKGAMTQASGILSSPVQTLAQAATGKDHFGRDLFDNTKPLLPQQTGYIAKQLLPGGVNEVSKFLGDQYKGKNPSPLITGARIMQLPIKEGTSPNPYFAQRDALNAKLDPTQQKIADYFNTSVANGGPTAKEKATMIFNPSNSWLLDYARTLKNVDGTPSIWSRSPDDIKTYLAYEQETNPQIKAQLRLRSPWLNDAIKQDATNTKDIIQQANDQKTQQYNNTQNSLLFKLNTFLNIPQSVKPPTLTPLQSDRPPTPYDGLNPEQRKVVDAYTASAVGSDARRQLLSNNQWLTNYWQANTDYYKQNPVVDNSPLAKYLTSIGINSSSTGSGGTGGGTRKLSSFQKSKLKRMNTGKAPKLRVSHASRPTAHIKMPKVHLAKIKQPKLKAIKTIKA